MCDQTLMSVRAARAVLMVVCGFIWPIATFSQIIGQPPISGNAKDFVEWSCNPCCWVKNKSSKTIKASIALSGASITNTLAPGEQKAFSLTPGGQCITGGFAIGLDFVQDSTSMPQSAAPAERLTRTNYIYVANSCSRQYELAVKWKALSGDWDTGVWILSSRKNAYLNDDNGRLKIASNLIYVASSAGTEGRRNNVFKGDHAFEANGRIYRAREMRLTVDASGDYRMNAFCAPLPDPPPNVPVQR